MSDAWRSKYDTYLRYVHERPNDGRFWLEFGKFLEEECIAPEKALKAYENAHRLAPSQETRLRLGSALIDAGNVEDGIALLRKECDEVPDAHSFAFLADGLIRSARFTDAREALESGLLCDPQFDELYYLFGESFRRERRYSEAVDLYKKAIAIDPTDYRPWQAMGQCELHIGNIGAAVDCLERATSLKADAGWAWQLLAVAYMAAGRVVDAKAAYSMAVEVFPEDAELLDRYGAFLALLDS